MVGVFLVLLLLSVSTGAAQELAVIHYGSREGLPSSYITCLAQGPEGRVWIGQSIGVSSYDGREFRTWTPEDGLVKVSPTSILATDKGRVWLSFPQEGLQLIDRDGSVATVPDPKGLLTRDHAAFLYHLNDGSVVLAGHKGYYEISPTFIRGPLYPIVGRTGYVSTILDERGSHTTHPLFATEDGLFRLEQGRYELMPLPYEELGSRQISVMDYGPGGELWMLNSRGYLLRWSSKTDYRIWNVRTNNQPLYPYRMIVDKEGTVWVASGQGLLRFRNGRAEWFTEDAGLSNSFIVDLLIDRDGILWLATESGLDKISTFAFRNFRHEMGLPVNSVWKIEEVADGSIWLGTNSGIVMVDPSWHTKVWTSAEGLPEDSIIDIRAMPDGSVWLLGYSGIYRWDGKRFISYPQEVLESLNLYEVLPLSDRQVWICSSNGVYRLDPRTNRLERHPLNDHLKGSRVVSRAIRARDGGVWLLGSELYHWRATDGLQQIPLPPEWDVTSVRDVHEDDGRFWVLTDRGLAVRKDSDWELFGTSPEKQLFDFVETQDGSIWLGCNGGIARFDGTRFHFYGYYDGIALNECNTGAALQDSRGVVWLGGVNVSLIFPSLLRFPPPAVPMITRVAVNGVDTPFRNGLKLRSSVRNLDFRFAATSYWNEQEQSFRYRLDGLDSDWSAPASHGVARYTGLSPGEYRFALQCRTKNGQWTNAPQSLPVIVEPAWWQTIYARILLVTGLIVFGFFIGYVRIRRLKANKRQLQNLVDEQTAEIKKQRDLMARLATTDELTDLPNRRKCVELLQNEMARARRSGVPFSVFLFDIDFFKEINDSNGHATGDEVLNLIARVGRRAIRETDTLGRWGGDEFILLMPRTSQKQAQLVSRRLKSFVEQEGVTNPKGITVKLTISGGIASYDPGISPDGWRGGQLVRVADTALYRAKQEGRSRIVAAAQ
ncbi:MAG: diguanylate cyclase [Acidobacteriota bacterium]|jgi:diguanylate cyclase (GGDEF)-like protein